MIPLLLAVLAAQPAPPGGDVVEEVVAVVRNPAGSPPRLVTRTKLEEEARIALVSRGAVEAAVRPLDAPALAAALQWLLDETLVADEAARLRLDDLDRDTVDREVARFAARFPAPAEYRAFLARAELPEEELAVTLARGLKVRRYLESRVGRAARVSEADVDRALAARGAAGASPAVREAVRGELAEAAARNQVAALVAELRARADIRVLREPGA
ncbi:MAG: hypothetical protein QM704_16730 [Anaeromyxobacteraceae bacterium]